jgi:hypothetical protein
MNVFYYLGFTCENIVVTTSPVFVLTENCENCIELKTMDAFDLFDPFQKQTLNLQIGK